MEGHRVDEAGLPNDEWLYWQTASKFGWTFDETDDAPALKLDMVLGIDRVVEEVKAEAQERANRESRRGH